MNTGTFNPLDYPLCLETPERLTDIAAWQEHIPFAFSLAQMLRPQVLVELGTHRGDSYCAFCQAVASLQIDCSCTAIDTWEGDEEAGFYGAEVLEELAAYHDNRYGSFSRLRRGRFDEALADVPDGSIDLLHIDGLHTYEAVRHDYESWLPKVGRRGVIVFHDIAEQDKGFGVWRLWKEVRELYPGFSFDHGHGLGVLGVGKEIPPAVASLFALDDYSGKIVRDLFSILGSRLTEARRVQREFQQNKLVNDNQLRDVLSRGRELETQVADLNDLLQNREQVLGDCESRVAEYEERLRQLESRRLELSEAHGRCQERTSELEQALVAAGEQLRMTTQHARNLEKIVNHPAVRFLRSVKRLLRLPDKGN